MTQEVGIFAHTQTRFLFFAEGIRPYRKGARYMVPHSDETLTG
jgi:hypothetical protein